MSTCAQVLAQTLKEAGIETMFGLPGGEILEFIEAARRVGIRFVLTRDETTASFMADVTGQMQRRPGVCVATLGPGAVNMTLGVANAFLDRSPLIAVTASTALGSAPYATHQNLDLNAVYRPFTKLSITLDGRDTAAKTRRAIAASMTPRMGPVHIALPSDMARTEDVETGDAITIDWPEASAAPAGAIATVAEHIRQARRPIVILGIDLDPFTTPEPVRRFVEWLGAPVFVTPKAKGWLSEDHPLFFGVCAGVAADWVVMELFEQADLLLGVGFEPVESDGLWHRTMKVVQVGPVSIAAGQWEPHFECIGDVGMSLEALTTGDRPPLHWTADELGRFRTRMLETLQPAQRPVRGLSPFEVTTRLRDLVPADGILATDVGSIKSITSQAWKTYAPLTFFESNGLSSMRYGFAGAMAARLHYPDRPVVCTIGDGGFGMTVSDLETCVRERIHFLTVVYNDSALSLIQVSQEKRGYASYGVEYSPVDFARIAEAFGVWSRRVATMSDFEAAVREALQLDRPTVIDVAIDPAEYRLHNAAPRQMSVAARD